MSLVPASSFAAASGAAPPTGGGVGVEAGANLAIGSAVIFLGLVYVAFTYTTSSVGWFCQTSSGNMQFALYDSSGTRQALKTSFASPGTGPQSVAWGSPYLMAAGWYYVGVQVDNGTISLGVNASCPSGTAWGITNTYGNGMPATTAGIFAGATGVPLVLLA